MFLTDSEYLKLHRILIVISDILGFGYSGKEDFINQAKKQIAGTDIDIETVKKVAAKLELFIF